MARKKTKKATRTKRDYVPQTDETAAPRCEADGCKAYGVYKAPIAKNKLHDYRWLCLDHIREHNAQWNYFEGMDRDEIESFMKDAMTGHRPTWNREGRAGKATTERLEDALYEFLMDGKKAPKPTPPLPLKVRQSLAVMDMEYPYTAKLLKTQYRQMVKKYHPDVTRGNKELEEKFKEITAAYFSLSQHLKNM